MSYLQALERMRTFARFYEKLVHYEFPVCDYHITYRAKYFVCSIELFIQAKNLGIGADDELLITACFNLFYSQMAYDTHGCVNIWKRHLGAEYPTQKYKLDALTLELALKLPILVWPHQIYLNIITYATKRAFAANDRYAYEQIPREFDLDEERLYKCMYATRIKQLYNL
jgi:hypothetical protein